MNKETFLNLDIGKQIEFYNDEIKKGQSFTKVSKNIGVSKSISEKFKKYGYRLIDGFFQLENTIEKEVEKSKTTKRCSKTIMMDSDLWKELKIYSVINDTNISDMIEQLAREFLKKNEK